MQLVGQLNSVEFLSPVISAFRRHSPVKANALLNVALILAALYLIYNINTRLLGSYLFYFTIIMIVSSLIYVNDAWNGRFLVLAPDMSFPKSGALDVLFFLLLFTCSVVEIWSIYNFLYYKSTVCLVNEGNNPYITSASNIFYDMERLNNREFYVGKSVYLALADRDAYNIDDCVSDGIHIGWIGIWSIRLLPFAFLTIAASIVIMIFARIIERVNLELD